MIEPDGLFRHLSALIGANLAYLRARLALAGVEGKEAAVHYAIILGLGIGALIIVLFGYFFVIFALVFLIAWACGGGNSWIWVTLGAGLLHFGGALALVFVAKGKLSQPVFTATLDEFRKDQECLRTPESLG